MGLMLVIHRFITRRERVLIQLILSFLFFYKVDEGRNKLSKNYCFQKYGIHILFLIILASLNTIQDQWNKTEYWTEEAG